MSAPPTSRRTLVVRRIFLRKMRLHRSGWSRLLVRSVRDAPHWGAAPEAAGEASFTARCRHQLFSDTPPTVQPALEKLWQLRDSQELGLIKLLSARLLWEVRRQPVEASPSIRYFTSSQVAIAREIREILCADLSQDHTARALAERFQVSETSLKNYFRGVFGENLTTFLREARMRRAAELLRDTELRVAEIAAQVGYENQSKFAAVFARQFGCPPLEYRRRARLH